MKGYFSGLTGKLDSADRYAYCDEILTVPMAKLSCCGDKGIMGMDSGDGNLFILSSMSILLLKAIMKDSDGNSVKLLLLSVLIWLYMDSSYGSTVVLFRSVTGAMAEPS